MMFRSTKGASKQRRDLINNEISQLRDLLPLPESARQRLSQLQIMSLSCCFIRKSNYFSKLFAAIAGSTDSPFEFFQAMSGFLLIITKEGKLLYISENVTEFLGHSMVDMMTQGDSIYDIIDKRDHPTVQAELLQGNYGNGSAVSQDEDHTFFCRMNVSRSLRRQGGLGDHKVMHVRGHFIQPSLRDHYGNQPVFMACVTPLVTPDVKETIIQNNTMIFQSVHSLDMKYVELAKNGEHHLGYGEEEMVGHSWYEYIHPEDIHEAKEKHSQLIKASHEVGCMLTVRLLIKDGSFIWINMVMHIRQPFVSDSGDPAIVCVNHVIDPSEANHFKLQSQLYSSHIARSPEFLSNPPSQSPPHTITQIPLDSDQYPQSGFATGGLQQGGGFYHGEFGVTIAPVQSGSNGQGSSVEQMPLTRSSLTTLSDSSSSDGSISVYQTAKKTVTRAELIDRLKRKLPQQCKPSKKPKTAESNNTDNSNDQDELSYFGSVVTAPCIMLDNYVSQEENGQQMLVQVNDRPVYAQLKKSIDLKVKDPNVFLASAMQNNPSPVGPLTPDSITSDGGSFTSLDCNTMLSIDVKNDVQNIPASILTPDASPVNSPQHTTAPSVDELKEQCVPSLFAELQNFLKKEDNMMEEPVMQLKMKPARTITHCLKKPSHQLPELDALSIDSYFGTLEAITKDLSIVTEDILATAPATVPENPTLIPSQPSPAPSSVSSSSCEEDAMSEEMFQLGEAQLANIVANVAESIMDMVQHQNSTANNQTNLMGDFMVIPSNALPQDNQGFAEVPVIKTEAEDEHFSPMNGELLSELHQLNQLAASSAPSYGETDLVDAFFNENL